MPPSSVFAPPQKSRAETDGLPAGATVIDRATVAFLAWLDSPLPPEATDDELAEAFWNALAVRGLQRAELDLGNKALIEELQTARPLTFVDGLRIGRAMYPRTT